MYLSTIVIPLKRQKDHWLEQCVTSAVEQSISCEVIVVTHPDTPESNLSVLGAIQNSFDNLIVQVQPRNRIGFASAINIGFKLATTDRLGLLLSDDWLDKYAVEKCIHHPVDIVSTGMVEYDDHGSRLFDTRPCQRVFDKLDSFEAKASYLEHFFLFNKKLVLDIGGVDESIGNVGPDDYDLPWTMLEAGAKVCVVEEPLYHYRDHHGERLTLRDRSAQITDLCKILDKHRVRGADRQHLIDGHSRWFGQPNHVVLNATSS